MSSCRRFLIAVSVVICLSQATAPSVAADGEPQGGDDETTALRNGVVAHTTAEVSQSGLRATTKVAIPVPAVYDSRSDGTTSAGSNPGTTTPPFQRESQPSIGQHPTESKLDRNHNSHSAML